MSLTSIARSAGAFERPHAWRKSRQKRVGLIWPWYNALMRPFTLTNLRRSVVGKGGEHRGGGSVSAFSAAMRVEADGEKEKHTHIFSVFTASFTRWRNSLSPTGFFTNGTPFALAEGEAGGVAAADGDAVARCGGGAKAEAEVTTGGGALAIIGVGCGCGCRCGCGGASVGGPSSPPEGGAPAPKTSAPAPADVAGAAAAAPPPNMLSCAAAAGAARGDDEGLSVGIEFVRAMGAREGVFGVKHQTKE